MQKPNNRAREQLIQRLENQLSSRVKVEQSKLYGRIATLVNKLSTTAEGQVKPTAGTLLIQAKVGRVFVTYAREQTKTLLPFLIRGLLKLLGLNRDHFKGIKPSKEASIYSTAVTQLFNTLGYKSGKVVKDSWLDGLLSAAPVKQQVMGRFQQAILGRTTLQDFNATLANDFLQVGVLSKHVKTVTNNLFIAVDRSVQLAYKEKLGLRYGLWSGVVFDRSTAFCKARAGIVYTEAAILEWNTGLEWAGKFKTGQDCRLHGHGHNCRFHVSWVTESVAEAISRRSGKEINSFN